MSDNNKSQAAAAAKAKDSKDNEPPPSPPPSKRIRLDDDENENDGTTFDNNNNKNKQTPPSLNWTNPHDLQFALRMGGLWGYPLPLKVTMRKIKPSTTTEDDEDNGGATIVSTTTTDVTITAVKRSEWDSIPEYQGESDEEIEVFNSDNDPDGTLEEKYLEYFRSFYHMNHERNQTKIFGHHGWHENVTGSVIHLLERFDNNNGQQESVSFYLSHLDICDEFICNIEDGTSPIGDVIKLLGMLVYQHHWVTQEVYGGADYNEQRSLLLESPTLTLFGSVHVSGNNGIYKVKGLLPDDGGGDNNSNLQDLANILQHVSFHDESSDDEPDAVVRLEGGQHILLSSSQIAGQQPPGRQQYDPPTTMRNQQHNIPPPAVPPAGEHLLGRYHSKYPLSVLVQFQQQTTTTSSTIQQLLPPHLQRLYQKLAFYSHVYLCQRSRQIVDETEIILQSEILTYLNDYFGKEKVIAFVACDSLMGAKDQVGWSLPTWAASYAKEEEKEDDGTTTTSSSSSLARSSIHNKEITATILQLRDLGVLDYESNEMMNNINSSSGHRRVLFKSRDDDDGTTTFNAVPIDESNNKVSIGDLPVDGIVH